MKHEIIMENWRTFLSQNADKMSSSFNKGVDAAKEKFDKEVDNTTNRALKATDATTDSVVAVMDAVDTVQKGSEDFLQAVGWRKPKTITDHFQPQAILNGLILLNSWSFFQNLTKRYESTIRSVGAGNNDLSERMSALNKLKQLEPWEINAGTFTKLMLLISKKPDPEGPRGQLEGDIQRFRQKVIKKSFTNLGSAREYADRSIKKAENFTKRVVTNIKTGFGMNEGVISDTKDTYLKARASIIAAIPSKMLRQYVNKYIDNKEQLAVNILKKIVIEKSLQGLGILIAALAIIITIAKIVKSVLKKLGKKAIAAAVFGAKAATLGSAFLASFAGMMGIIALDRMIDDSHKFATKILGVELMFRQVNQILPIFFLVQFPE